MEKHKAIAIMVNGRYFHKFGKSGRLVSAWCLAGAELFGFNYSEDALSAVEERLRKKGYKPIRVSVAAVLAALEV